MLDEMGAIVGPSGTGKSCNMSCNTKCAMSEPSGAACWSRLGPPWRKRWAAAALAAWSVLQLSLTWTLEHDIAMAIERLKLGESS